MACMLVVLPTDMASSLQTIAESAQAVYTLMYGAPAGGVRCVWYNT